MLDSQNKVQLWTSSCFVIPILNNKSHFFLFLDGGRLEKELRYVEEHLGVGAGATNEMLIQTPYQASNDDFSNILTSEALLAHLDILHAATRVVVEKDDA